MPIIEDQKKAKPHKEFRDLIRKLKKGVVPHTIDLSGKAINDALLAGLLTTLQSVELEKINNLRVLNLANNELENVNFIGLKLVRKIILNLSANRIHTLKIANPHTLLALNVLGNDLRNFDPRLFTSLAIFEASNTLWDNYKAPVPILLDTKNLAHYFKLVIKLYITDPAVLDTLSNKYYCLAARRLPNDIIVEILWWDIYSQLTKKVIDAISRVRESFSCGEKLVSNAILEQFTSNQLPLIIATARQNMRNMFANNHKLTALIDAEINPPKIPAPVVKKPGILFQFKKSLTQCWPVACSKEKASFTVSPHI